MPGPDPLPPPARHLRWPAVLVVAVLLILLVIAGRRLGVLLGAASGHLDQLGMWAPAAFVAACALATVLFLPAWPLTIVGGALFGLVRGTLLALGGATLG